MILKKIILFALTLSMAASGIAQTTRLTDDRELFIGVSGNSLIAPNVMILMDNSGSMETAIYHPLYNLNVNYKVDSQNHTLSIDNLDSFFTSSRFGANYRTLRNTITFNICRGVPHYSYTYDARGTFIRVLRNNPRRWQVNKGTGTFDVGDIIDYNGDGSGVDDQTRIIAVVDRGTYWDITVDTNYADWGGNPDANSYVYVNYHQVVDYTDATIAHLTAAGDTCTGYGSELLNVKLYGTTDVHLAEGVLYDVNYLYWLCFHATNQQVAEVTNWVNTGNYVNPVTGITEYSGYYRLAVTKDVLTTVAAEVYQTVRLGLSRFKYDDDAGTGGGMVMDVMQNNGNLNEFQTKVNLIKTQNLGTPLAETMADIWYYFKGGLGNVYWPNGMNGTGSNCGTAPFPASCPIQYWCQKSYVIVMTDGQSTADDFNHTQYLDSYFCNTPVTTWGDGDDHNPTTIPGAQPTDLTKPDGSPYCPNNTCWIPANRGTDLLDDMAYFMRNEDLFPDALYPDMPDKQNVETFVIGFNADNDMLAETAKNGNGEYYTANSYTSLKNALKNAIVNILLRNFAFAAFTAPKKITTTAGEGFSYVGYFLPSASTAIWEGHLQSYKLTDKWCPDSDNNGKLNDTECDANYPYELTCENANPGVNCLRSIDLATVPEWDTAEMILNSTTARNLYTHDYSSASPTALINFTDPANLSTLQTLFGLPIDADPLVPTYRTQAQAIVDKIKSKIFGDIFHSDITYVGAPLVGKKYLKNLNPSECSPTDKASDSDCFEKLLNDQSSRAKVLYVGTNDGVIHQVDALSGIERWGFIPDSVLPSLKSIVLDNVYTFNNDGRMVAEDFYFRGATNAWKTGLFFGQRDGGQSYYALDITSVSSQPTVLWKFNDVQYSGKSWGRPNIGKIRYLDGTTVIDRWVMVVPAGFAFNNANSIDVEGKAVFVIDISTGQLLWMVGYNALGAPDQSGTVEIDTSLDSSGPGLRYLTSMPEFNYSVPSSMSVVDRDSDGYLDTAYFGNVAGHLFKINMADSSPGNWKTYLLFKQDTSTYPIQSTVSAVTGNVVRVGNGQDFEVNQNVFGLTSKAMGIIDAVDNRDLTITYTPASGGPSFQVNETIVVPTFDPIFLAPAVAFDPCYNLWVTFGTGDRIRSRTNPTSGKLVAVRDGTTLVSGSQAQKTNLQLADLVPLTWSGNTLSETEVKVANKWGWYFNFPNSSNYEKMFDPDPLILPDLNLIPHIFFNTYQPPSDGSVSDECNAPREGSMFFYDIKLDYCNGGSVSGERESGRIAGGGMFQGTDFILYEGTGTVGSVPPLQDIKPIKLIYTGGLMFWKEKKR